MNKLLVFASLILLASALSCAGGTETGNPAATVSDFSSSSCKNRAPSAGQQALTVASDADGLQCVEWATTEAGLRLKLLNFPEGCADEYFGAATVTATGALELSVYKDVCAVAACGSCVFDFEYELAGVPRDKPLPLRIGHAICPTEATIFSDELTLPIDERESGIVCRYLDSGALAWYAPSRGTCGQRNMPCGDCDQDGTTCAAELQCTAIADRDSRCLTSCSSDDDCLRGLTSCRDGVCQANTSW
jgi:hypothetical protein